jgi:hypothetical protein
MATIACTVQRSTWYNVYFEYSYTQDTTNAKTTLTHALKLEQLTDSYDFDTVSSVTVKYTVNGTSFSKSARINIDDAGNTGYTITLASGTTTITHDSSGEGAFTVAVDTSIESGGWGPGTITLSKTVDLPAIARASVLNSVTGGPDLDDTITYKYTSQNAALYSKLVVALVIKSSSTYSIRTIKLGKKAAGSYYNTITFTADELDRIYSKMPSATSASVKLTLLTYSDSEYSDLVLNTSYKTITLSIPSSEKPAISFRAVRVNDNPWIAGKNIYVAGFSKVTLTLTATPTQGTTIASTTISGDGFSQSCTSLTVQLDGPGDFTFTGTAVDSRGRSASQTISISVLPYIVPLINSVQVDRGTYNSGWTTDEKGSDVRVIFETALSLADNGNTYDATFELNGVSVAPDYGSTTDLASETPQTVYFSNIESESSHPLNIVVVDSVGKSSQADIIIPTTVVTIEFNKSGKGISFGKTSEKDAFECAMDAEFNKDVYVSGTIYKQSGSDWIEFTQDEPASTSADEIVEQGTDGIWTYRKWSSGVAECWGTRIITDLKADQAWGSLYHTATPDSIAYPFTFTDVPTETAVMSSNGMSSWMATATVNTESSTGKYFLMRPNAASTIAYTAYIHYQVKGKWQ